MRPAPLLLILMSGAACAADPAAGMRIYREGVLSSGQLLRATVSADVAVAGSQWRCEACHRRSGLGAIEAGTLVPPITAHALFRQAELNWADRFPSLFEEVGSAQYRAHVRNARARPGYTAASLAKALRLGVDPTGRTLDPAMPRYRLSDADMENLAAYLATLGRTPPAGVDAEVIHFATVTTDGVDPVDRGALLAVLEAWCRQKDREAEYHVQKLGRAVWHKEDEYRASRRWALDVWELRGTAETWTRQLAENYRRQPVFAVIGGLASGPWQPIADFCEQVEVPCLFPDTSLPGRNAEGGYTVYFSRGIAGEAAALAAYLRGAAPGPQIVQVYRDSPVARAAAAAFQRHVKGVVTLQLEAGPAPPAQFWQTLLRKHHPDDLVIWADNSDVRNLPCRGPVQIYLSATLAGDPRSLPACKQAMVISPYADVENPSQERARMRTWQLSRGIPLTRERIQLNAQFALSLLDYSLDRMLGRFSRDYLMETIERETETSPNPGVFLRLGLGPGQRFASKGAHIVRFEGDPPVSRPVSPWIVP